MKFCIQLNNNELRGNLLGKALIQYGRGLESLIFLNFFCMLLVTKESLNDKELILNLDY